MMSRSLAALYFVRSVGAFTIQPLSGPLFVKSPHSARESARAGPLWAAPKGKEKVKAKDAKAGTGSKDSKAGANKDAGEEVASPSNLGGPRMLWVDGISKSYNGVRSQFKDLTFGVAQVAQLSLLCLCALRS